MLITQTTEFRLVFSPRTIVGTAMVTIVVSSRIMKNPIHNAVSAAHWLTGLALTGLVIVSPRAVVHDGQVWCGRLVRFVVRPWDPAGLQVLDQPFGPGQLGLALVVHERELDPVHVGQLPGEPVIDDDLVAGDPRTQVEHAQPELLQHVGLVELVRRRQRHGVLRVLLGGDGEHRSRVLDERVPARLGQRVDRPLRPATLPLRADDLAGSLALQPFYGAVERPGPQLDPLVDPPVAHDLGHLVRMHVPLVEQLENSHRQRGQWRRGLDHDYSLPRSPCRLFRVDYTTRIVPCRAEVGAARLVDSTRLRASLELRQRRFDSFADWYSETLSCFGQKLADFAPKSFSNSERSATFGYTLGAPDFSGSTLLPLREFNHVQIARIHRRVR